MKTTEQVVEYLKHEMEKVEAEYNATSDKLEFTRTGLHSAYAAYKVVLNFINEKD